MDFTIHSIPMKYIIKFRMKSANEPHSEIHDEILLILVKSVEFNDILKGHEKHLKSEKCNFLWKMQVLFIKSAPFHVKGMGAFHKKHPFLCEKHGCFSWNCPFSCEKHGCFSWKASLLMWKAWVLFMTNAPSHVKSTHSHVKSNPFHVKSTGAFHEKCPFSYEKHPFTCEKCGCFSWKASLLMWKVPLFKRPFAGNCNPMFYLLDVTRMITENTGMAS